MHAYSESNIFSELVKYMLSMSVNFIFQAAREALNMGGVLILRRGQEAR